MSNVCEETGGNAKQKKNIMINAVDHFFLLFSSWSLFPHLTDIDGGMALKACL
jgi:hypothetical protein